MKSGTSTCRECGQSFDWRLPKMVQHRPRICPECSEADEAPSSDRESTIRRKLDEAGVNVDAYADATLESFEPGKDEDARYAARAFVEAFRKRKTGRPWLYLHGPTGNGKTHLAVAVQRKLIEDGLLHRRTRFVNFEMLLLQIQETYDKGDGDSAHRLVKRFADYELLTVDDVGVSGFSDHTYKMAYLIAEQRAGRPTIWTSNLSPDALQGEHSEMDRVVSRVIGNVGKGREFLVELTGRDRRVAA